jgi:hypothetical protein
MPKLTAIGEVATAFQALPKDFYVGHVRYQAIDYSQKTGAPMVCLCFEVDEGDYKGARVPGSEKFAYRVMVGGKKENGEPHDLGRLFATINALQAEWSCGACGLTTTGSFVKERGRYFCPSCGKEAALAGVTYDTDTWQNLQCRIQVDIRDIPGFEDPVNEIKGLRPLAKS